MASPLHASFGKEKCKLLHLVLIQHPIILPQAGWKNIHSTLYQFM
jgi:hypothetical protein